MLPFALVWTGVGLATAIITVFAYRLFNLWLPLVPAAAASIALRRSAALSP
jgi:biopolymer transport protein ExbB/TolQ